MNGLRSQETAQQSQPRSEVFHCLEFGQVGAEFGQHLQVSSNVVADPHRGAAMSVDRHEVLRTRRERDDAVFFHLERRPVPWPGFRWFYPYDPMVVELRVHEEIE